MIGEMIESKLHIVCSTCGGDDLDIALEKDYRPNGPAKVYSAACRDCDCAGSAQGIGRVRLVIRR